MRSVLAASLLATALLSPALAASDTPTGVWMTEDRDSKIRIAPCGKALCASVLWARKTGLDENNPNPSLRNRPLVGLELSRDVRPDGQGGWKGSFYNPENGKTYQATLQLKGERELEVGGCVLGGLLCGSETWVKQGESTASVTPGVKRP